MPLLNYTTQVAEFKTVSEIQSKLAKAGAHQILHEYNSLGIITALSFRIKTQFGDMAFRLPANLPAIEAVLKKQLGPRNKLAQPDQAARVGWRIVKDWVEAQLALIETGMVTVDQVFFPYLQDPNTGQTLYESIRDKKFAGLLTR